MFLTIQPTTSSHDFW